MIFWSVADEKLVVNEMLPSGLTRAVLASVIPTCCTGGTVGLQDATGDGVAPGLEVKPPIVTEGSEPSEELSVAEESAVEESVPGEEPGAGVACPDAGEDFDDVAGPAALAPVLRADPGCAVDWLAEGPETDEGEPPADAPVPGTGPAAVSVLPAEVEPAPGLAVGVLPLQPASTTATTRSEAVSQRDLTLAALAPNCPMTPPPRATPRRNARHPRSHLVRRRPQPGLRGVPGLGSCSVSDA